MIGIVPARGGSKGVPRKVLREVAGVSLLEWTLRAAHAAGVDTWVTTEDLEIRAESVRLRSNVVDRPERLAADRVPDLPVVRHALERVWPAPEADDIVLILRPTSPFRTAVDVLSVTAILAEHRLLDSVRSVRPLRDHPWKVYYRAGIVGGYAMLEPADPVRHMANGPRQWLRQAVVASGFLDAVRAGVVLDLGSMDGLTIAAWPTPEERGIDIDTEEDLARADALARRRGWTPESVGP